MLPVAYPSSPEEKNEQDRESVNTIESGISFHADGNQPKFSFVVLPQKPVYQNSITTWLEDMMESIY